VIIATLFVGSDLLITVFSYGTWAVFFKKSVGSIIIAFPISYFLYWLEQHKIRKRLFKEIEVAYEEVKHLVSIGWNREVAIRKVFGEGSQESINNPIKQVGKNVIENSKQNKEKDLAWEYGIHNAKESTNKNIFINFELDINKSFAWFINRTLPTKIIIIFLALLFLSFVHVKSTNNTSYQSYQQEQDD
ncbi:MAG: hypothetical protein RBT52_03195, partial [Sulfurimonas sp.]|nr:hypothetical protein [Sulfurimonas sp.]